MIEVSFILKGHVREIYEFASLP